MARMSDWVGFIGTSTQFRSLAPSLTQKAGTESPTVKESRRYINVADEITRTVFLQAVAIPDDQVSVKA